VALTGRANGYYTGYRGSPQELLSELLYGYLYQGQWYEWQKKARGTPTFGIEPFRFVTYLENHDQISNSGRGRRLHQLADPGSVRAMTALWLLSPGTPMFFQGQEFAASSPFQYFADHAADLGRRVSQGRKEFLAQFDSLADPAMQDHLPDACDPATFERCKLNFAERESHAQAYRMHRDLLKLRREDPCFASPERLAGAVLGEHAFVVRFFGSDDRLLLMNLGLDFEPGPEPLLAPPENRRWRVLWSSEDPRYGGCGTPALKHRMKIPGHAALVLSPQ
jgi:maltooligosyltrehalose trehalohydrolase